MKMWMQCGLEFTEGNISGLEGIQIQRETTQNKAQREKRKNKEWFTRYL